MKRNQVKYIAPLVLIICILLLSSGEQDITQRLPTVGTKAPELAYPSPNDDTLRLSDLRGNIVLLDFWASWCGPCRRKNPEVVALYNKYVNEKWNKETKGFMVFSVSLDQNKDSWISAIKSDSLTWKYHVSDLRFWNSEGAKIYGVRAIPMTFLVDEDGYIIAVNPSHGLIEEELNKRLKSYKPPKD